jgi:hypothetical protein
MSVHILSVFIPKGKTSWQTQHLASKRFQTGSFIPVPGDLGKMGSPLNRSLHQPRLQTDSTLLQLGRVDNPEAVDALFQKWDFTLAYAFPPIPLLKRVVKKLETSNGTFILVSPLWEAQTWLALLLMLKVLEVR